MKQLTLTEEQASRLEEMISVLFKQYGLEYVSMRDTHFVYDLTKLKVFKNTIHWLEFCLHYLSVKLIVVPDGDYNGKKSYPINTRELVEEFLFETFAYTWNNNNPDKSIKIGLVHPVDYLYNIFKK